LSISISIHPIGIYKSNRVVNSIIIRTVSPILVCQRVNPMPNAQLRVLVQTPMKLTTSRRFKLTRLRRLKLTTPRRPKLTT
jgi:hypothetical protein